MRVTSWNVNGLRGAVRKGFLRWLHRCGARHVAIQETRVLREHLPEAMTRLRGWHLELSVAERPGYSGVGQLSRVRPDEVQTSLGRPELDREARLVLGRYGRLWLASVYFPNGNGKDRDLSRVPFKLAFYRTLRARLQPLLRAKERVLVAGDFNLAPNELDLARPEQNRDHTGFLLKERRELFEWFGAGWLDTYRCFEHGGGHFTWWSQREGVRAKNVGWRIDLMLASPALRPFLKSAAIHAEVHGSDHCPISVELDARAER